VAERDVVFLKDLGGRCARKVLRGDEGRDRGTLCKRKEPKEKTLFLGQGEGENVYIGGPMLLRNHG